MSLLMRVMGLDPGDKRTGVAISDPLGWTAQGKKVIESSSFQDIIKEVKELIEQYEVEKIIVGLPRNMDGSLGERAQRVEKFIEELKSQVDIPVKAWDERLSTAQAERTLLEADLSRQRRKQVIDKMAAVMILQNYLDQQTKNS